MKQSKEHLAEEYRVLMGQYDYEAYYGFLEGFNSAEKQTVKIIKDLKNKYGSWLSTEQGNKLGKTINQEEVLKLKSKLELLKEIEKKLGL